jgi:Flp pilus assembly protein TadG
MVESEIDLKNEQMKKTERGQSMTELAISFVFLMILLAGVIDLGRAFFAYMAMRDAAQEGASYGAIARSDPTDAISCSNIEDRVRNTSSTPVDLQSGDIQVDILLGGNSCASAALADACLGKELEVTVSYNAFPITMPFLGTLIGTQHVSISTTVIDTILLPSCD